MTIYKIVRSKGYKNFMAKMYGMGAAVVILGALFKILHWQGADYMLMVGMGAEAIIFFFSSFEPLHKEYDWTKVYPELIGENRARQVDGDETLSEKLNKMLADAKLDAALIDKLAIGMNNLSENAKNLSLTANAAVASDQFVTNLTKANEAVGILANEYEKTAKTIAETSEIQVKSLNEMVDIQKQNAQKLQDQQLQNTQKLQEQQLQNTKQLQDAQVQSVQKLQEAQVQSVQKLQETQVQSVQQLLEAQAQNAKQLQDTQVQNVQKLQDVQIQNTKQLQDTQVQNVQKLQELQSQYVKNMEDMQLQGNQTVVENYKKITESAEAYANAMQDSAAEAQKYKQEIDKLSQNVAQINSIYANMLAAMTNK